MSVAARLLVGLSARARGLFRFPVLVVLNRFSRQPVVESGQGVAVCLTTYGVRLASVHLVIESIARGLARPALLVLWLSQQDASRPLPPGLRRLQGRGLCIRSCDDWGSHKKYFPFAISRAAEDLRLVTADDDVYYPRRWLYDLIESSRMDPSSIWCYRSRKIMVDAAGVAPYRQWPLTLETGPSFRLVPTGVSGVLYPRPVLEAVRSRGADFANVAPSADDLWLHSIAVSQGVRVRRVRSRWRHFPVPPSAKGEGLMSANLDGGNDRIVERLYDAELMQRIMLDPEVSTSGQ